MPPKRGAAISRQFATPKGSGDSGPARCDWSGARQAMANTQTRDNSYGLHACFCYVLGSLTLLNVARWGDTLPEHAHRPSQRVGRRWQYLALYIQ